MIDFTLVAWLLAAAPVDLSAEDFKMFRQYQLALQDARVQKMKPKDRLGAIARNAGFPPRALEKAVARGEAAGDIKARCEAAVSRALEGSPLAGKAQPIELDVSQPHAVGYVGWRNENPAELTKEAAVAAGVFAAECPLASTIQVWAQSAAAPEQRVFRALISGESAARIKPAQVNDFAETRYRRLFEQVKSVAAGDDLTAESGKPAAGQGLQKSQ